MDTERGPIVPLRSARTKIPTPEGDGGSWRIIGRAEYKEEYFCWNSVESPSGIGAKP